MAGKRLVLEIGVSAGNGVKTLGELRVAIDAIAQGTGKSNKVFSELAKALQLNFVATKQFAESLNLSYETIAKSVVSLKQLESEGANTEAQFAAISGELGLTREQFDALSGALTQAATVAQAAAEAAQQAGEAFGGVGGESQKAAERIGEFVRLAKTLGTDLKGSEQFANDLGLTAAQANKAIALLRELQSVNASTGKQFQVLSDEVGLTADQFAKLSAAAAKAANAEEQTKKLNNQNDAFGVGVGGLALKFNAVVQAAQTLIGTLKPAYDLLIGSNERLNQELLRSASNIAATNRVFQSGIEVNDPAKQIAALQGPLRGAIEQLQKDTQSLVGVTSQQVNQAFGAVLQNVGQLNNQSVEFKDGLSAATALTPKLVAGIGAIGLPLEQINQEVRSLLQGQISSDSQLARSLGITNKQVQDWKASGVLVDKLNESLAAFVAANQAASQSIGGYSSNIQDIVEVVSRNAGVPLFELATEQLGKLYNFLQANQDAIQNFSSGAIAELADLLESVLTAVNDRLSEVLPALIELGEAGAKGGKLIVDGLTAAVEVSASLPSSLAPILEVLGKIAGAAIQIIEVSQEGIALLTGGVGRNTEALDAYAQATQQLGEEGIKANTDLKAAIDARNAAQENGTALTEDQLKAEASSTQQVQGSIDALKQQRQELENFIAIGPEAKRNRDEQVASIDRQINASEDFLEALQKTGGGVTTQARELQVLGSTYEQLSNQVENAQRNIATATGQQQADEAAKQLIELTQQQLSLGQITSDEAATRLKEVSENTRLGFQVQSEATKELSQIQQTEGDRRVQAVQQEQNEIRRLQAEGNLSDAQAERQLTQLKIKELQTRLENVRAFLAQEEAAGRVNGERAIALRQQEAEIITQIAQTQADAEKQALEERLKEIERAGREAIAAAQLSETERQTELQQLINQGVLSEEDANQRRLQSTRDRIQAELDAERQKLAELQALPQPTDPDEQRNLQDQIRDQVQRTAQLQLNLLENERQQQEAQAQAAIQAIRDQATEQEQSSQRAIASIERQKAAQDAVVNSIQRQSQLLQSQQNLQGALANLASTRGQIELDNLNQALQLRQQIGQAEDAGVKRVLQAQLRRLGISGSEESIARQILEAERQRADEEFTQQQRSQQFAMQANELEIKRNELLSQRAITEARIAEIRAQQEIAAKQADLAAAQEIIDPAERERAIASAQLQIELSQQGLDLARQATTEAQAQAQAQEEIAQNSRLALSAQQQVERATSAQARNTRISAAELARAEVSARRLGRSLTSTTQSLGIGGGTPIRAFKDGGVASPGVAVVGEQGPELIRIGSTSRIWSNQDSAKLAPELFSGPSMSSIAPVGMPQGDAMLISEIRSLKSALTDLDRVNVGAVSNSYSYHVAKDEKAIAEAISQSQIDLVNSLRIRLNNFQ